LCGFTKQIADQFGSRINNVPGAEQLVMNNLISGNFRGVKDRALDLKCPSYYPKKRLHAPVMDQDDSNSYSFWAAKNKDPDIPLWLGLLERQAG